jgi:putative membrane protein
MKKDEPSIDSIPPDDFLEWERTQLANKRTLLSFIRTALAFFAAAASLIQFFDHIMFVITGYLFIPIGCIILFVGFYSYSKTRKTINDASV